MVIDKRPNRYVEINSYQKRRVSGRTLITKYLREVGTTKAKVSYGQNRQTDNSTGAYVRDSKNNKNNNSVDKVDTKSDNNAKNKETTNTTKTRGTMKSHTTGEIKIKKEQIEAGIEVSAKYHKTLHYTSDEIDDTIELMQSSSDDESSTKTTGANKATLVPMEGWQNHGTAVTKRPWATGGSRKKLKQYYRDVKDLAETTLKKGKKSNDEEAEIYQAWSNKLDGLTHTNSTKEEQNKNTYEATDDEICNEEFSECQEEYESDMIESVEGSDTYDAKEECGELYSKQLKTDENNMDIESNSVSVKTEGKTTEELKNKQLSERLVDISKEKKTTEEETQTAKREEYETYDHRDPLNARKVPKERLYNKKDTSNSFTVVAKSKASIKEQMVKRGTNMVESKKLEVTAIKIEFNVDSQVKEYNARAQLIRLMELMKTYDKKLQIQNNTEPHTGWKDFEQLPEDEKFGEKFNLVIREFRTHKKVILHCKVISEKPFNAIKYSPTVKQHIFEQNIWIKIDRYESRAEGSPGFFTMIHPRMVQRDVFTHEIREILKKNSTKENSTNKLESEDTNERKDYLAQADRKVPEFHLEVSKKKWGTITMEVLRVNCALEQADTLKKMLVEYSDSGKKTKGMFVPIGIHLMTTSDTLKNILVEHDKHVTNVRGVPLRGITEDQMHSNFRNKGKSLREVVLSIKGVTSIEMTRDTSTAGKWIVLTDVDRETAVTKSLSSLFKQDDTQDSSSGEVFVGNRVTQVHSQFDNEISTYAAVLKTKFSPRQENRSEHDPKTTKMERYLLAQESKRMAAKLHNKVNKNKQLGTTKYQPDAVISNRVTIMEDNWKKLEIKLDQIQGEDMETKYKKLADKNSRDNILRQDNMLKQMEKKLDEIRTEQKNEIKNIEERLNKQIDKKLDSKADQISVDVANHVVERLMELMQPQQGAKLQTDRTNQSTITQEGISSPQESKINRKDIQYHHEQPKSFHPGDTAKTMLTAIEKISLQQKNNSHHDAIKGNDANDR